MLNEIRPNQHKIIQHALLLQDISELLEREFDEHPYCPACESLKRENKFKKYELNFVQCKNCQTIYMNPRPSKKSMNIYYETSRNYKFWAEYIFPNSANARTEMICKPSLKRIKETLVELMDFKQSDALEIGPGFGLFADLCNKERIFRSFEVLEPTPPLATHCENIGLNVHKSDVESFKKRNAYHVIFAFEVIEHIYNPSLFLQKAKDFLCSNGFIVLSCPNGIGFDTKMLGPFSPSVDNEHVNLFSPKGIENIFYRNGFKLLSLQTPGKMDAEIVSNFFEECPGIFESENKFKKLLKENNNSIEVLQDKISKEKLSGHMWAFGQKL
tara:strand:- start:2912 stop:3895 length:984 start_codon:yes stop_codon:yes gene_type:complete